MTAKVRTRTTGHLDGVEAMRGVAAVLVILYHCGRHMERVVGAPVLGHAFQFGHAGVDMFFVLSGFIILHVHMRDIGDAGRLRHYAARRFTRVMPTYWVALAVTLAMQLAGAFRLPTMDALFWSVTLIPSDQPLILGIAWTLRNEILFYAVFAVAIVSRAGGVALFGAWAAAIMANLLAHGTLPASDVVLSPYNLHFFLGMGVAWCAARARIPLPRCMLLAGLVLLLAMGLAEDHGLVNGYGDLARLGYGLPSAMILLGIIAAHRQGRLTVPALLSWIGGASYSLYIFQFVFIGTAWQALRIAGLAATLPAEATVVILAAAATGGGLAVATFIERPLIRLCRSLGSNSRRDTRLPAP